MKIKVNVFMEFLKSVTTFFGWGLPSLGSDQPILDSEFFFSGVDPPWVQAGLLEKVSHHP